MGEEWVAGRLGSGWAREVARPKDYESPGCFDTEGLQEEASGVHWASRMPLRSCRRFGRPFPLVERMCVCVPVEGLWVETCVCVPAAAGERGGAEDTGAAGGDHETGPQSPPSGEETGAYICWLFVVKQKPDAEETFCTWSVFESQCVCEQMRVCALDCSVCWVPQISVFQWCSSYC